MAEDCLWLPWGSSLELLGSRCRWIHPPHGSSLPDSATAPNSSPTALLSDCHSPAISVSSTTTLLANFSYVFFGTFISLSTSCTKCHLHCLSYLNHLLSACSLHPCIPQAEAARSPMYPIKSLALSKVQSHHPTLLIPFPSANCVTSGHSPSFTEDFGVWLTVFSPPCVSWLPGKIFT